MRLWFITALLLLCTPAFAEPALEAPAKPDLGIARLALQAADAIYELPDLENGKNGQRLFDLALKFVTDPLPGFHVHQILADPSIGLKVAVLTPDPVRNRNAPIIVTFAGTQSTLDWLSDLDDGHAQAQSEIFSQLLQYLARTKIIDTSNLLITGHSLGGALAQTLAYGILRDRALTHAPPGKITVVTGNALGATELAEKIFGETLRPDLVAQASFSNYYVEGDMISRIGVQIGGALLLKLTTPMPAGFIARNVPAALKAKEVAYRHILDTLRSIPLETAIEGTMPPPLGVISQKLKNKYPQFQQLQRGIYRVRTTVKGRMLIDALHAIKPAVLQPETMTAETSVTLMYLATMAFQLEQSLTGNMHRELKDLRLTLMRSYLVKFAGLFGTP